MKRKIAGLLAALIALSMTTGAMAADFKDLPASHWAYAEITRAVSYGIMNGLGDGRMNPDGTLTWAHYLAMISRTFAPMAYEGARSSGTDWKTAGYQTALNRGYLLSNDFLTVTPATLNDAISRQDVAVLLSRTLPAAPLNSADPYVPSDDSGSGSGSYSVDTGTDADVKVVTDSNGQQWVFIDGVSIPISSYQAVEIVVGGQTSAEKETKDGRNTLDVAAIRSDDGNTSSAWKKNASGNFTVTPSGGASPVRAGGDDGETTAPVGGGRSSVRTSGADNGETTAPVGGGTSSVRTGGDSGETTGNNSSSWESGGADPIVIAPAPSVTANPPLSDFNQMDANHQAALRRLYDLEIVRGKSDGSFGPYDDVRRCDGAVLLMRTLDAIDELRAGESVALTLELTDGDGKAVGETVTGNGRIGQRLSELAALYAPTGYKVAPQDGTVSVITSRYALKFAPLTQAEKEEIEATAQYQQGQISYEEYMAKDFWLKKLGDNARKRLLIFGAEYTETIEVTDLPESAENTEGAENPEGMENAPAEPVTHMETVTRTEIRYDTPEEAQSHMTAVEVPVWKLRGSSKVAGTINLTVNAALAEEVKAIFTEIYNDPEQFPISDGGGYSWRTNSRSEHIQGTAIDLNVDSNFQVRDGAAMVGTHWTPGEDPYSITPGGSVVRVFAEHGWDWGGNAWAGHSDPTYGYHDYMHFSYFGR